MQLYLCVVTGTLEAAVGFQKNPPTPKKKGLEPRHLKDYFSCFLLFFLTLQSMRPVQPAQPVRPVRGQCGQCTRTHTTTMTGPSTS